MSKPIIEPTLTREEARSRWDIDQLYRRPAQTVPVEAWAVVSYFGTFAAGTFRFFVLDEATLITASDLYALETRTFDPGPTPYAALLPLMSPITDTQLVKLELFACVSDPGDPAACLGGADPVTTLVKAELGLQESSLFGDPDASVTGETIPYLVFNPYTNWSWVALKPNAEEFTLSVRITNDSADAVNVRGQLFAMTLSPPKAGD